MQEVFFSLNAAVLSRKILGQVSDQELVSAFTKY